MAKRIFLACTLGLVHAVYGASWAVSGGGSWNTDANWQLPMVHPDGIGEVALFLNAITADATISGSSPITVGTIHFDDNNRYTVTLSGNFLVLDNGAINPAEILVTFSSGNVAHTITAPIILAHNLIIEQDSPSSFFISGSITGGGTSLTKTGNGVLVLSGENSYTGGLTISAGEILLTGSGTLPPTGPVNLSGATTILSVQLASAASVAIGDLSGVAGSQVQVSFDQNLTFGGAGSATFAGVISGGIVGGIGATITKRGTGVATLTGVNTVPGGTTINAGTLNLSGSGALTSGAPLTLNGAGATFGISAISASGITLGDVTGVAGSFITLGSKVFTFGTASSTTIESVISGVGGSIVKQGSGTVVLSGANTFTGGISLNAGALQISADANLGAATGSLALGSGTTLSTTASFTIPSTRAISIASSATFEPNALAVTTTVDAAISGGALTKAGAGTLVLTSAANSYTGGTTISAGTFSLSGAGALVPTSPVSMSGATSAFDISATTTGATIGDLSGVAGSSLAIGTKALTFGTAASTDFAGAISGSGILTKQGSGTFDLSGASTFTGTFNVNAGKLNMSSTGSFPFASTTNIAADAILTGTGTLGALNLSGMIAPGNSIGTINVGDITFNAGSTFLIELNNTDSDRIVSSGIVTINSGSTLMLIGSGLTFPVSNYLVIDSSMPLVRNGNFTLVNPFTRFVFGIEYEAEDVTLIFLQKIVDFSAVGNAAGPAECFNTLLTNLAPDLLPVLNVLNVQTRAQWQDSFNQMQPSNFDNIAYAQENVAESIRQSFSAHLFEQRLEACSGSYFGEQLWRVWATPFMEYVRQDGKGQRRGYTEHFRGFTAAADYQFVKHWTLTSGFSYADSDVNIPRAKTSGDFKTYAGTVGTIWTNNNFFADGLFSYLFSQASAKREMNFVNADINPIFINPPVTRTAHHRSHSNQLMGHIGGGYDFKFNGGTRATLNLYPFIDIDYMYVMQGKYKESGAQSLNLKVNSKGYDLFRIERGLGFGYAGCFDRFLINADVSASYVREQRFLGKKTKASFQDSSCTFTVKGLSPTNNLFSPTARITVSNTKGRPFSFSLGYHGEFGSRFHENAGEAELKVAF